MKKSLLALAALTAFTGVASAQSSVTLFGIADLALRSTKNGSAGDVKTLSHSGGATSRLGFRGVEDLGGGMRAGFWIEGALNPDDGGTGQNWQRRSTVSLMGGFGEVRLGRDYTPTFLNWATLDIFNSAGVATSSVMRGTKANLGTAATTETRVSNSISYFLPAMGGLSGQVQVSAGEGVAGNKALGARLGYAAGPITVSAAFLKTELGADDLKTISFGGSFNAGFATFGGIYEKSDAGTRDQKLISLTVSVPVGAGAFKGQYTKSSGNTATVDGNDAKMFGLGYVYSLSKRTTLYANYANVNNGDNTKAFVVSQPPTTGAMLNGEKSTGYEFGVRHDF